MVMSRNQNAGQSLSIKTDNSSFARVDKFKYLGTILTNQNSIQDEIKSRLKSGNACYYSVQNILSSSLLSKNIKIKIYRTIILLVGLYGCETRWLTLRE
jgi:UDP-galactopyranose mutase